MMLQLPSNRYLGQHRGHLNKLELKTDTAVVRGMRVFEICQLACWMAWPQQGCISTAE